MRLALALALVAWAGAAGAHDIYSGLMQPGTTGLRCCGGEGKDADCEPLQWDQIHERRGSFVIDSRRYGHPVLVPTGRIVWSGVPGEAPGTAGHWCGVPRERPDGSTSDYQPDPSFVTYCIYIAPGGT